MSLVERLRAVPECPSCHICDERSWCHDEPGHPAYCGCECHEPGRAAHAAADAIEDLLAARIIAGAMQDHLAAPLEPGDES